MSALDFFHARAGYSYDPKTETKEEGRLRTAKALAAAERERVERGFRVSWEPDPYPCAAMGEGEEAAYEAGEIVILTGTMTDEEGNIVASIGGVSVKAEHGTNDLYLRVVEAEMAREALGA